MVCPRIKKEIHTSNTPPPVLVEWTEEDEVELKNSRHGKYLRFATGFLTLGGNLLRVNRFFSSICVCDTQTQMRCGNAPVHAANHKSQICD